MYGKRHKVLVIIYQRIDVKKQTDPSDVAPLTGCDLFSALCKTKDVLQKLRGYVD